MPSKSPYFFNAGLLYDGKLLSATADAFAETLQANIPDFDVLFGPAYKGIPLAAVTCVSLANKGVNRVYCYNRKEKKDVSRPRARAQARAQAIRGLHLASLQELG